MNIMVNLSDEKWQRVKDGTWCGSEEIAKGTPIEPCSDAISRQAAISAILTKYTEYERLKMLHFTPNIIKQECADLLTDLPSIQPIRSPGHWIKTQTKQGRISETWYHCSECGWRNALYLPRSFCPNCGADMREEQTDDKPM